MKAGLAVLTAKLFCVLSIPKPLLGLPITWLAGQHQVVIRNCAVVFAVVPVPLRQVEITGYFTVVE